MHDALELGELDRDGALREAAADVKGDTRTAFFKKTGAFMGGGLALGALPVAFASGSGVPASDVKILNYALTLEYLEAAFYAEAVRRAPSRARSPASPRSSRSTRRRTSPRCRRRSAARP